MKDQELAAEAAEAIAQTDKCHAELMAEILRGVDLVIASKANVASYMTLIGFAGVMTGVNAMLKEATAEIAKARRILEEYNAAIASGKGEVHRERGGMDSFAE